MITIDNITIKNFLSIGNVTQAVNFHETGLTLVLGNNLDLGGGGSRNGVGKTSLVNALSYALYGAALSNIKKDNLINKTNSKGMLVTVDFSVNGTAYTIKRGRRPNVFQFIVNGTNISDNTDEGQGEGRLTQHEINKVFGLNHVMFKHLIALNTYNEPFLSLRANDQRDIIEHLLGITMLSEKAVVLKELLKTTKDNIKEEEYKIKATESANIQIEKSISDLQRRQRVWANTTVETVANLNKQISDFQTFDIEDELESHILLDQYNVTLNTIQTLNRDISRAESAIRKEERLQSKAEDEVKATKDHTCYACGQHLHDEKHLEILTAKQLIVDECMQNIIDEQSIIDKLNEELSKQPIYSTVPQTRYKTAQEAYEHQNKLSALTIKLSTAESAVDPYYDQIINLQKNGVQEISWGAMNRMHRLREHQDFLLKLLTNKDSFIRKRIIEQNLIYLNTRLSYYLTKLGLPHEVQFQSDLTVEITELGRELDFDNLSRGERNRLILGLSWAFRDVHESMNTPIDFMAIDELMDSGLDSNGVENALGVLKNMNRERNKNILLISHREELVGRVNNILYVVKENGFTRFSNNQEFDID